MAAMMCGTLRAPMVVVPIEVLPPFASRLASGARVIDISAGAIIGRSKLGLPLALLAVVGPDRTAAVERGMSRITVDGVLHRTHGNFLDWMFDVLRHCPANLEQE